MRQACVLAFILSLALPAAGRAGTFDFTFEGDLDPFFSANKLSGTVTGQIVLPNGDGTFLPTSVTVTSYSTGLTGALDLNLTPTTWDTQVGPGFTVLGGAITDASWAAQQGSVPGFDQIRFNFDSSNHFNAFFLDGDDTANNWNALANDDGFAGVTYSAASTVPEPTTTLLLGSGLIGLAMRKRPPR
jgi:PEP-CTERM motif